MCKSMSPLWVKVGKLLIIWLPRQRGEVFEFERCKKDEIYAWQLRMGSLLVEWIRK